MPEQPRPVRVDQIDWVAMLPWIRLFRSFRMAIQPSKLLTSLLLVVLVYLGGRILDAMWGPIALIDEVRVYQTLSAAGFAEWRELKAKDRTGEVGRLLGELPGMRSTIGELKDAPDPYQLARNAIHKHFDELTARRQELAKDPDAKPDAVRKNLAELRDQRAAMLSKLRTLEPRGVFAVALQYKLGAFDRMVNAAIGLRFGFGDFLRGATAGNDSVVAAMRDIVVTLPGWLYRTHPGFMIVYWLTVLVLFALLGGSVARMAALDATGYEAMSPLAAVRFAVTRFIWFFLTPLVPLVFAGVIGLLLMLGGFVFFNLPVLDIAGSVAFAIAMFLGFMIALLLLLSAAGGAMFYPALAIEGTDSFDAVSRAFGYVIGRPWHWLFYTVVSLIYGAVTYLFVGTVIFLTLRMTHHFVGVGAIVEVAPHVDKFNAVFPQPRLGELMYPVDWHSGLSLTGKISASIIWGWVFLAVGLLGAYAVNFYICSSTWIYLLLRRSADGAEMDEICKDRPEPLVAPSPPAGLPEKVERQGTSEVADET